METEQSTGLTITPASLKTLTKTDITELSRNIVYDYLEGYKSPAEGLFFAKKLKELAEQVEENLKGAAADELKLSKGEKREFMGATVNEQMVGVRYDYASTGDKQWIELNAKLKDREKFLQGIKGSVILVDEGTGEVYTVFEPVKSGKMSLIFKY